MYVFPMSYAQKRLWFLDRLVPGSAFYNLHHALKLPFALDEGLLEQALNEIVRRHEILRTTFAERGGEPVQIVAEELSLPLARTRLDSVPASRRRAAAAEQARAEASRGFDLTTGPLLRTRLLTLGRAQHLLLLTIHHIVFDAWSLGVFVRELSALYQALAQGRELVLPELPIQYADFAVWQREHLSGKVLEEQLDYWRGQLAGAPVLELPTDRPRPPMPSFAGAIHTFSLPAALVAELGALARQAGGTLFMALLTGFLSLLHRYTGQSDLVVGTPVANRNRTELEPLIGFFVNTLVLRTRLREGVTSSELLSHVRDVTLGAYAHQDLPFEKLVEELRPQRELSHNPLFQVTFQLHNEPGLAAGPAVAGDPDTATLAADRGTANFDLALNLWLHGAEVVARFEFATDLLDSATVVRMTSHFRQLLSELAVDPGQRVSTVPLLLPDEQRQLLHDWNVADTAYPAHRSIHRLFEEQADLRGGAPALVSDRGELSYAELDRRANRIAHGLERRGVGPGAAVGLCLGRSQERIAGLLGILKAGGAYVALDPGDPLPRLAHMAAETRCAWVLTETRLVDRLAELGPALLPLDADPPPFAAEPDGRPARGGDDPTAAAYVTFTSGSTGGPKGVCVTHRGVVRLVRETDYAEFGPRDTFLQLSPLPFDASTFEIWAALLNGARLAIPPPGPLSLEELGRSLDDLGVTVPFLTTGLFHQMVDAQLDRLRGARRVFTGGDVLSPRHARTFLEQPGAPLLVNCYGPAEASVFVTCMVLREPSQVTVPVTIGRVVANGRVYVLDRSMNPVPVGVPGELCIGGPALARGYLKPSQTAERFIPDPFAELPGERLFLTGDRVRYRDGGRIDFLGRRDRQVKVRGFRIELAHVEAVAARHPAVREVVVEALADASGDKRLVAYVTARGEEALSEGELRVFLQDELPAYMLPSTIVLLDAIPLTPHGKVDREALPDAGEPRARRAYVAPRNEVEEGLARIWREVFEIERIGVLDDFFTDLGGHSLLGTLIVSRIRAVFGAEMPLRLLFEAPTIEAQALAVEDIFLAELEALDEAGVDPAALDPARELNRDTHPH